MIKQQVKNIYYDVVRWITLPNYYVTRLRMRRPEQPEGFYLHLGCGASYIPGMINIDINLFRKKELWLDLRNDLPFPAHSACFVYCSHVLEHFYPDEALRLLGEIRRVLKEDGIARIAVPCLEHALAIANGSVLSQFPRPFEDAYAQAINYLFCDGQHKYGYSYTLLKKFAQEAGFRSVYEYSAEHAVTTRQYRNIIVGNEPAGSLVVELKR